MENGLVKFVNVQAQAEDQDPANDTSEFVFVTLQYN